MTELTLEAQGADGVFAVFSEDEGAGYFYVYEPKTQKVLEQIRIYETGKSLSVQAKDVEVLWSTGFEKCGVSIWGRMRGVIDLANGRELSLPLESRDSQAVIDRDWLKGFDNYCDWNDFVRARQEYWKSVVKKHDPDEQPLPEAMTPIETNFILAAMGPRNLFAVFEDDGATGYLYLYNSEQRSAYNHLHIYDRKPSLDVQKGDAEVAWSSDMSKCGVRIWDKMRGIINIVTNQEGRVWLESRQTPGVGDAKWLSGFGKQ